jgi:hypothetical protein
VHTGDRSLQRSHMEVCAQRCVTNCLGKPNPSQCASRFIARGCKKFSSKIAAVVKTNCLNGIACKGGRRCPDKTCAKPGVCCPGEKLCPNKACAKKGTCCSNEKKCPNGTCVSKSATCGKAADSSKTVAIDGKNVTLDAFTDSENKTTVKIGNGAADLVITPSGAVMSLLGTGLNVTPTIDIPFSSSTSGPVDPDGALILTEFLVRQVSAALSQANSTGARRLDNPGCDSFPDSSCSLGCCAVHDRCYAENGCNAKSWIRNLCLPLVLGGATLGNPIATGLGTLICTVSSLFISGECAACNQAAFNCIVSGCVLRNGADTPETCYDNKCNVEFECDGVCDLLDLDDSKCCGCQVPGAACGSPASCGNGVCDYGESLGTCFVDCAYNQCTNKDEVQCGPTASSCVNPKTDAKNCGACGISCPSGSGSGLNACVNGRCSTPLSVSWQDVTSNGLLGAGGWKISNDGRTIRFAVEDSENCGGPNGLVQSGTAGALITVSEDYLFVPEIVGVSELQNTNFENMLIEVDGVSVISATSTELYLGCQMGPSISTTLVPLPLVLGAGPHTFNLSFTTADPLYHVGAYYELNLVFQPAPK